MGSKNREEPKRMKVNRMGLSKVRSEIERLVKKRQESSDRYIQLTSRRRALEAQKENTNEMSS